MPFKNDLWAVKMKLKHFLNPFIIALLLNLPLTLNRCGSQTPAPFLQHCNLTQQLMVFFLKKKKREGVREWEGVWEPTPFFEMKVIKINKEFNKNFEQPEKIKPMRKKLKC